MLAPQAGKQRSVEAQDALEAIVPAVEAAEAGVELVAKLDELHCAIEAAVAAEVEVRARAYNGALARVVPPWPGSRL